MQKFFVVEKAMLPVITDDLIASAMHFKGSDSVIGQRRATVYNEAQKAVSSLTPHHPFKSPRPLGGDGDLARKA